MNDTNYFYAVFYSLWRFNCIIYSWIESFIGWLTTILPPKLQTETMKNSKKRRDIYAIKRDFGLSVFYAKNELSGLLIFKSFLFAAPIAKYIEYQGINRKLSLLIPLGLFFIIICYIGDAMLKETVYRKYINKYEKKSNAWKRVWGIITIIDIVFSLMCVSTLAEKITDILF